MNIITKALSQYGISERLGHEDHPQIIAYFDILGYNGAQLHDETAWCSAFANWVAKTTGHEYSGKLTARSWLNVGISTATPQPGDVVVLWRESPESWKGHVGFFVKATKRYVYILGGNQKNSVCISAYPKTRVLDYKTLRRHGKNK